MDVSSYSTSRRLGIANIHPNEGGSDEDGSDEDLHQLEYFRRKLLESAVYSSKYDRRWKEKYPSIQPIKSDSYSFLCTVHLKRVSSIIWHVAGISHNREEKQTKKLSKFSFPSSKDPLQEKICY